MSGCAFIQDHGRRADGLDLDWMPHVNPGLAERALLSVYNPTDKPITKTIAVPLYYSGLVGSARVSTNGAPATRVVVDPHHRAMLEVTVPANGYLAAVFQEP